MDGIVTGVEVTGTASILPTLSCPAKESQVHVDNYKMRLYQSLRGDLSDKNNLSTCFLTHEGPVLAGYQCGNTPQIGCLTNDINVRIHSCEKGMHCEAINEKTVW